MSDSAWPYGFLGDDPPPIPIGCVPIDGNGNMLRVEPVPCEWCGRWTRWTHKSRFGTHMLCHGACMELFMEANAAIEGRPA